MTWARRMIRRLFPGSLPGAIYYRPQPPDTRPPVPPAAGGRT